MNSSVRGSQETHILQYKSTAIPEIESGPGPELEPEAEAELEAETDIPMNDLEKRLKKMEDNLRHDLQEAQKNPESKQLTNFQACTELSHLPKDHHLDEPSSWFDLNVLDRIHDKQNKIASHIVDLNRYNFLDTWYFNDRGLSFNVVAVAFKSFKDSEQKRFNAYWFCDILILQYIRLKDPGATNTCCNAIRRSQKDYPDSSIVIKFQSDLARMYAWADKEEEGELLFEAVLARSKRILGPSHYLTKDIEMNLSPYYGI